MPLKNQSSNSSALKSSLTLKNLIPMLRASLRSPEVRKLIGASLGWGGAIVFGSIAIFFVSQLLVIRASIKSEELFVSTLTQKYNAMLSLESSADVLELNQALMDAAMPSEEGVPELMGQIQKIATESGVSLQSLQYGGSSKSSSNEASPVGDFEVVTMQASGSTPLISGLITFLKNLESGSRVVSTRNVSFSQTDSKDSTGISIAMTIDSYYIPSISEDDSDVAAENGFDRDASKPLSFDITSPEFTRLVDFLKTLRIYKSETQSGSVGKSNPFQ